MLKETFASVKTEFLPLDGQSWDTPAGRREIDLVCVFFIRAIYAILAIPVNSRLLVASTPDDSR